MRLLGAKIFPAFRIAAILSAGLAPLVFAGTRQEQDEDVLNQYLAANTSDSVAKLVGQIKSGTIKLTYEPEQGYLRGLLKALGISPKSQILVFSKTSFQTAYISHNTPRAIYFNDHVYVGWIPGAPNIEIASVDPLIGPVFYTVLNHQAPNVEPARQTTDCLQCHDSPMTGQVPGVMSRSVYAGYDGMLQLAAGSFMTTAASPLRERWGGWYVTGKSGRQLHMGNEVAKGDERAPTLDMKKGTNVTDLGRYLSLEPYLTPHSDLVALMVAEQQMTVQDLIIKAEFLTRKTVKDSVDLLKFGFEPDHVAEEERSRFKYACEPLVEALLCAGEPKLTDHISGTSGFAELYAVSAPTDKLGRRLSELDLTTRLLKYSCSPMIYSASFRGLPAEAKQFVFERLHEVLAGKDKAPCFDYLGSEERKATLEILTETVPGFEQAIHHAGS